MSAPSPLPSPAPSPDPGTVPGLLAAALREGGLHLGRVLALARAETDANLAAWLRLTAILGAIPIVLIAAFFLGLDVLVKLVALPLGSEAGAALVVAAPFLAAALALGWFGARRLSLSNLEPWRSWRAATKAVTGKAPAGDRPGA